MSAFPTSPAEITTDWLGQVLGQPVADFRIEPIGEGIGIMACLARVHLTYADPGTASAAGAPPTAVFKYAARNEQNRQVAVL